MNQIFDLATIVLVGSFNPRIFQPEWFVRHGLLQAKDIEGVNIEIISNDYAIFELPWLKVEVLGDRFMARTEDESKFSPLKDLVVGTFKILEHTPISAIGLNREISFDFLTSENWHRVGHSLAPKLIWEEYVDTPGMMMLLMQSKRTDDKKGSINIKIRPAAKIPFGVTGDVNDHVDLPEHSDALDACKIIDASWDQSLEKAEKLITGVLTKASQS